MARFKPEVAQRPTPLIVMTYDGWSGIRLCPLTRDYVFMNNSNEPAFPRDHQSDGHNGMSLRDYFAAKAMQAAISQMAETDTDGLTFRERADWAYKQADAMMEARQ